MGKFVWKFMLILVIICAFAVVIPSSISLAEEGVIPLEQNEMPQLDESCFISDTEYKDASLHITLEKNRLNGTNYVVARIKIAHPSQLRSALVSPDGKRALHGSTLAKKINVPFAINGDQFAKHLSYVGKHIVRQGKVFRSNASGVFDAMIIDDKGDITLIPHATNADIDAFEGEIVNSFAFGPALIIDGELQTEFTAKNISVDRSAQRMAFAQTGELSYMCIVSEGPECMGSKGFTLPEFATLIHSFGEVENAYNLDGGSSATLVFHNKKFNSPQNPKIRSITDLICFASAVEAGVEE